MSDTVLIERHDGAATVTLTRPALSVAMKEALAEAVTSLAGDDSVRAVVLAGSPRAFCVGQDLKEHAALLAADDPSPLRTVVEHYNPIARGIAEMPKPVVAAVAGVAAGAGMSLALLADLRVGGPGTRFVTAFAGVALGPDTGMSWTLQRLVGGAKATELLLLGEPVGAEDAHRLGLLNRLVDDDASVLSTAQELALRLAAGPTVAYGEIKRTLALASSSTLAEALAAEADTQDRCGATEDHRTATAAFLAKEQPTYSGR